MNSHTRHRICQAITVFLLAVTAHVSAPFLVVAQEPDPWHVVERAKEQSIRKLVQRFSAFWDLYGSTADRTAEREKGAWVVRQHDISREITVDSLWFSNSGKVLNFRFDKSEIGYCAMRKRNLYVFLEPYSEELPDPVAPTPAELESQIIETEELAEEQEVRVEPQPEIAGPKIVAPELAEVETEVTEPEVEVEPDIEEVESEVEEVELVETEPEIESVESEEEKEEITEEVIAVVEEGAESEVEVAESALETGPVAADESSDASIKLMIEEYEAQLFALQNQLDKERLANSQMYGELDSLRHELHKTQRLLAAAKQLRRQTPPVGIKPLATPATSTVPEGPSLELNGNPPVPLQPWTQLIQVSATRALPFERVTISSQHKQANYKLMYLPVGGQVHTYIQVVDPVAFWRIGDKLIVTTDAH